MTKKLWIFDLDFTLIITPSKINYSSGGTPDYSEFDDVAKPSLIKRNFKAFKLAVSRFPKSTFILTARARREPIERFFEKIGIRNVNVVALANGNPQAKASWIERMVKRGFNDVYFIDDLKENLKAVRGLREKYPNLNLTTVDATTNRIYKEHKRISSESFLTSILRESPDSVISKSNGIKAIFGSPQAWTVAQYKGKMYAIPTKRQGDFNKFTGGTHNLLAGHIAAEHGLLDLDSGKDYGGKDEDEFRQVIKKIRSDWRLEGRLWTKENVISFWDYPKSKSELFKVVSQLRALTGKSLNGLKIEVPNKNFKKHMSKSTGSKPLRLAGDKYNDLIPIEDYIESRVERPRFDHVLSPMLKKSKSVKGFGSDKIATQYGSTPIRNRFKLNKGRA